VSCLSLREGSVKVDVTISPVSGQFEVIENESVVLSGHISILTEPVVSDDDDPTAIPEEGPLPLNRDDIYKELRLRGYDYESMFRAIVSADRTGKFC